MHSQVIAKNHRLEESRAQAKKLKDDACFSSLWKLLTTFIRRLFGVNIRINPWFWLMSAVLGWSRVQSGVPFLLIWMACVLVSILVHEFGHVMMGRLFGSDGHIVLYSFGGLAVGSIQIPNWWKRVLVSLAGPMAGFLLWGMLILGDLRLGRRSG